MLGHNLLACGAATSGPAGASTAVKFDGSTNYLERGANLTSSTSKQGTVSLWFRSDGTNPSSAGYQVFLWQHSPNFGVMSWRNEPTHNSKFLVYFSNSAGTEIFRELSSDYFSPVSCHWNHVVISWDLSQASSTCKIYVNDIDVTTTPLTYSNATPGYASATNFYVGNYPPGYPYFVDGGVQHLYFCPGLYLDLSNSANRRLFNKYDSNNQLVPVNQDLSASWPGSTTPAIYLPLTDPSTAGLNKGSGGNFTANGTFAKASSAPDDRNVNAVTFNGSTGYLNKTFSFSGKTKVTVSFWAKPSKSSRAFTLYEGAFRTSIIVDTDGSVSEQFGDGSSWCLTAFSAANVLTIGSWNHVFLALDYNSGSRACIFYVNGTSVSISPGGSASSYTVGALSIAKIATDYHKNEFSELWISFDNYLTDVTKFRDATTGLPVYLGANGELPTGTAPAIYLPNPAATVEKNAGSGGDFTRNGTLVDAHSSPFYYYAEPVKYDGSTASLGHTGDLTGVADGKAGTLSFWGIGQLGGSYRTVISNNNSITNARFICYYDTAVGRWYVIGKNASGTQILSIRTAVTSNVSWHHFVFSWDLATGFGKVYRDGVDVTDGTITLTNDTIDYAMGNNWVSGYVSTYWLNGSLAELFFNTASIDITNPTNLTKFINATTGRPAGNLTQTTGITPLVYLPMDYNNAGVNLGSGGDFTKNGTFAAGSTSPSDVKV